MFNVSLIISCGLILIIGLLSFTLSHGNTITQARILYHGPCSTSNSLDLFLQFVINIFSTCVLASSNFFMQIVSSPTRKELDHAHRSLHSLEIGVSSFKNLGSLSWFKILAWGGLFLTSVPIHLVFNSAIYPIDYQGSDWNLTIATPGFVNQTIDYFVPGASLAAAGSSCPSAPNGTNLTCSYSDMTFMIGDSEKVVGPAGSMGYGLSDSLAGTDIDKAARDSSSWDTLTPSECFDQYRFCRPRQQYRDLVVVVDERPGWTRSEVYNFSGSAGNNLTQFWDPQIPQNGLNSLWFSTLCRLYRYGGQGSSKICDSSDPYSDGGPGCSGALGEPSGVDWIATTELQGSWRIPFRPANMTIPSSFGYDEKFSEMPVKHCRVEPNPEYICKLGLAPPLVLIVIGCVFVKGGICAVILSRLTDHSLVTPGDAISSFISQPDPNTVGLATMGFADADRLEYESVEKLPPSGLLRGPMARRWKRCSRRFKSVLSRAVWIRTYSILIAGMALISTGLGLDVTGYGASTL